jgi:pimeloyl-ACP methyl ester carboxylesterase
MVTDVQCLNRRILVDKNTSLSVDILNLKSTRSRNGLPTLLFIHGLGSNKAVWSETAESICRSSDYTCILVDLRGHGESSEFSTTQELKLRNVESLPGVKSEDSHRTYSLAQSADDLAVVIRTFLTHAEEWKSCVSSGTDAQPNPIYDEGNAKKLVSGMDISDKFVAIGHSYGSNVAMELCARHPSLVSDLIFVDGGYIDLQRTFPDYNSCFLTLRPPSFAGISADHLESTVRNEWALEGGRRSELQTDEDVATQTQEERTKTIILEINLNNSAESRPPDCQLEPAVRRCWSERGIQAILKNFRVVTINTTTSMFAQSGDAITSSFNSSSSSSSSGSGSGSGSSRTKNSSSNCGSFTTVHTVLSFKRYVQLLEDLWHRRPCEQFAELIRQHTQTTSPPPIPIPLPLSHTTPPLLSSLSQTTSLQSVPLPLSLTSLSSSLATDQRTSPPTAHTLQAKGSAGAGAGKGVAVGSIGSSTKGAQNGSLKKKSVLIIYAGAVSPFSSDKVDDIRAILDVIDRGIIRETAYATARLKAKSVACEDGSLGRVGMNTAEGSKGVEGDDVNGTSSSLSLPVSSSLSSCLSVRVLAFPQCGHNMPLQVPDDLAGTIHAHLTSHSHS